MANPDDHLHRLSTAQQLAVAVLQGDLDAVAPLLDHLTELSTADGRRLVPLKSLQTGDPDRLRAVFYFSDPYTLDSNDLANTVQQAWRDWLSGRSRVLGISGIDRLEVYEVPEHVAQAAEQKLRAERQAQEEQERQTLATRLRAINEHLAGASSDPRHITLTPTPEEREAMRRHWLESMSGLANALPADSLAGYTDEQLWQEVLHRDLVPPGAQPWRGWGANWGDPPAPSLGESNDGSAAGADGGAGDDRGESGA